MAVIKHISIKNSNYDAAVDYLTLKHDEFTNKPILDENGNKIPRDEFLIEGIGYDPFTFGRECEATNALFHKNQNREDIKAHHYIISFDPRDRDENGLTSERAQALAMNFARKNFPGHQIIVCTHPDSHNSAGNIHVHIVFNSVRKTDVPMCNISPEIIDTVLRLLSVHILSFPAQKHLVIFLHSSCQVFSHYLLRHSGMVLG